MRSVALSVLLLAGLAAAGATAAGKKIVPAQLGHARYVCLGYDMGNAFLSEQQSIGMPDAVLPEDRRALDAIRDEIERWGRYAITLEPRDAELLIAVRTARHAVISGGVGTTGGSRGGYPGGYPGALGGGGIASSGSGAVEVSSPYDMLTVYESRGGQAGAQLWRVQQKGALSGTPPKAFLELREGVDALPQPAKKNP